MARIRTIKPEFFSSEDIISLTPLARLFYVSLWCESDREGRLSWNPKTLKYRYFPGDDCDINLLANELIDQKLITVYEVDGREYAEIPRFESHQVINNRESESKIPKIDASTTRESGVLGEGKGREGKEGKGSRVTTPPKKPQPPQKKPSKRFKPPTIEEVTNYCLERKNGINPQKFIDHYTTNGWMRGKTPVKDWKACVRTWEGRDNTPNNGADYGGSAI